MLAPLYLNFMGWESIHTQRELVNPEDWLAKVDLKDAYFRIPIQQSHRKYLRLYYQDKYYKFQCLTYGLSSAPSVFPKTLKPALALLREMRVGLIAYVDHILILVESSKSHAEALVYLLQCLSFRVNQEISILEPAKVMEFRSHIQWRCKPLWSHRDRHVCFPSNHSVPSQWPDPYAAATVQDWSQIQGSANPPWTRFCRKYRQNRVVCSGYTSVDDTAIIPATTENTDCNATHDQVFMNRDPEDLVPQLAVAYLRERY